MPKPSKLASAIAATLGGPPNLDEARRIWGVAWQELSVNRERDRTSAYLTLLRRLADNGEAFVPELISPKDYAELIIHIEAFVKSGDVGAREGSAIEAVQRFLSGVEESPAPKAVQ